MAETPRFFRGDGGNDCWQAQGCWQLDRAADIERVIDNISGRGRRIDATALHSLDAAGAMLLLRAADVLGLESGAVSLRPDQQRLFDAVASSMADERAEITSLPVWQQWLAGIGRFSVGAGQGVRTFLGFLGLTLARLFTTVLRPARWRVTATVFHMQQTGLNALPLTVLLALLVGAVVAYLGATVLRDFGALLFVIDLIAYAFLREFGVLLTAILLAGRTASAFAAQIGTMKSREEIDAMRTLGLDPIVLLVLPRLLALLVMLPVLAFMATIAGFVGGMLVSVLALGIEPELFWSRLHEAATLRSYLVGLIKAPLFAIVIAVIGCLEGFKVTGTAQSVGERTTSAVVQSITLVIVIDALAAIFFMELGW